MHNFDISLIDFLQICMQPFKENSRQASTQLNTYVCLIQLFCMKVYLKSVAHGKKNKRKGHTKPHYRGKPLQQLLKNLSNHDVGRLIVRGSSHSYMCILTVDMASKILS